MAATGRRVIAALGTDGSARVVVDAGVSLARLVRAEPVALLTGDRDATEAQAIAEGRRVPLEVAQGDPAGAVIDALRRPGTVAGAIAAGGELLGEVAADVVNRAEVPVLVVPGGARVTALRRLVVAMDGSCGMFSAAAHFAGTLRDASPEIVVVHVFDDQTTPSFLDRPARDLAVWEREFVERRSPWPAARLRWATGDAGAEIVEAARAEDADAIVIGWWQDPGASRAIAAREVLARSRVPVLLLPIVRLALLDQRRGRVE